MFTTLYLLTVEIEKKRKRKGKKKELLEKNRGLA